MKKKIVIIQPHYPHYREYFFDKLSDLYDLSLFVTRRNGDFKHMQKKYSFNITSKSKFGFEYTPILDAIIKIKPHVVIIYCEAKQLANYVLLFNRKQINAKIIAWGHGFSLSSFSLSELMRYIIFKLSDAALFYTKNCSEHAKKKIHIKKVFYLNNTIDANFYLSQNHYSIEEKEKLKKNKMISHSIIGIFNSRFTEVKAPSLLLELMIKINKINERVGFIIIGDGPNKPSFSNFDFIYDFGEIYTQDELYPFFQISDFGFMPRWVGLSVIDVFANGLPMISLSQKVRGIKHSVEFQYINHNENGLIFNSVEELLQYFKTIDLNALSTMGVNARNLIIDELNISNMIKRMVDVIESV